MHALLKDLDPSSVFLSPHPPPPRTHARARLIFKLEHALDLPFTVQVLAAVEAGIKERTISKRGLVVGKRLNIAHAEPDADKLIAIGRKFSASVLKGNGKAAEFKREVRHALVESSHHWENTWMTEFSEDYLFWTPGTFKYVC